MRTLALGIFSTLLSGYISADENTSMVDELNRRYNLIESECPNGTALSCTGVLVRSAESNEPTWAPSGAQMQNSVLASSFIRRDIGADKVWAYTLVGYGIIYGPAAVGEILEPEPLCIFPTNGSSNFRDDRGCGPRNNVKTKNTDLSGCAALDITTAEQWLTLPSDMQCSFSVYEPYEVNEAIRAQILYNDVSESKAKMWNEVVVDTSKWNKPISSYPIQAIFYHRGYLGAPVFERGGLEGAKYEQIRFFEESNKVIPIVAIDDKNIDYVFSYNEEDQAIHE